MNLFLMRGLIREAAHWGEFYQIISAQFPEANIFCIEIPGTGQYNHLPTPLSIPKIVAHCRKDFANIVSQSNYKNLPNYIVAVSLGGMLTVEWIKKYPYDFKKAILVNTSLKGINPLLKRILPGQYKTLISIARSKTPEEKERRIIEMVSNNKAKYHEHTLLWSKINQKRPVSTYNAARQIFAGATYNPPTEKPKIPILLVRGEKDRMVDPTCSEEIATRWGLELISHPEAGHDLSLDAPEWLATQVRNWI